MNIFIFYNIWHFQHYHLVYTQIHVEGYHFFLRKKEKVLSFRKRLGFSSILCQTWSPAHAICKLHMYLLTTLIKHSDCSLHIESSELSHFKEFKKISNGADSIISTFRNKPRDFVKKEVRKFIYTWRSSILKAFSFPLKKTVLFLNEEKS